MVRGSWFVVRVKINADSWVENFSYTNFKPTDNLKPYAQDQVLKGANENTKISPTTFCASP